MGRKKRLPRLQDVVTWGEMTDNQVVFNHNGTFQKTYVFRGADGSNMTEDGINSYYVGLNNILMRLKRNYYVLWKCIKGALMMWFTAILMMIFFRILRGKGKLIFPRIRFMTMNFI